MLCEVEAHGGGGDHQDVEVSEEQAAGGGKGFEAFADDVEAILGEVDEGGAGSSDAELPEARSGRGDGDGEV